MNSREYRELQDAYFGVYEIDEAMMDGPRKTAMAAKQHSPYATSRDRATAFNVGVRDDRPRDKKSTGGKGERYSDFGDRGAGNKARRKQGLEPMRGDTRMEQVDLHDAILSHLLDEGYADTLEAAEGIMVSMSEEWREEILDEAVLGARKGHIRSVIGKGGSSIKYVAKGGDIVANDRAADERAGASEGEKHIQNMRNASRLDRAHKKSIQTMNSDPNIPLSDASSMVRRSKGKKTINRISPRENEYDEVPTDYRARKRRASGR